MEVELTHDNSPIQKIKDNTIYLNIDLISSDEFEMYLAYNVRQILLPKLILETPRLILRKFELKDEDDCFEFLSDKQTCLDDGGYLPFTEKNEEYNQLMNKFLIDNGRLMIYLKEQHKVIGTINLMEVSDRAVECKEVGYVISPNYRRKGNAYEAVSNLVKLLLDDLKLDMIIAGCFENNIASKKMLEKLCFTFEGRKRKALWDAVEGPKDLLYFYREKIKINYQGGTIMFTYENVNPIFNKWLDILRLRNNWDIKLELINDDNFKKTGDFKIDPDDRKALLMINAKNPKNENVEEVIIHELLHLKLYPLDQLTEGLIDGHYNVDTPEYNTIYTQFMTMLEQTVEELTKCFLLQYGDNKELSYGRCKTMKSFNALYDGLKSIK